MTTYLKQSTAVAIGLGPFVDAADGYTSETALTINQADVRLKKNGDAWAQKNDATATSHEENGWYEVALNTTDTGTLGILIVAVASAGAAGARPVYREFMVVPANVYDALVGGTDVLQADVTQFGGTAGTFAAGRAEVNTSHWGGTAVASAIVQANAAQVSGDAIAADTLELFAEALDQVTGQLDSGSLAAGTITAAAVATGAIDADAIAADAVTEIQAGLATAVNLATVDTVVDAIKAKTDSLTFTQAGVVDSNVQFVNDVQVQGTGASGNKWRPV